MKNIYEAIEMIEEANNRTGFFASPCFFTTLTVTDIFEVVAERFEAIESSQIVEDMLLQLQAEFLKYDLPIPDKAHLKNAIAQFMNYRKQGQKLFISI